MNRRFIIASLSVWAFIWLFEGVFHGIILNPFYMETAEFWRPRQEMDDRCVWLILGEGIFSFLFTFIFTKGRESRDIGEGARYGWWVGLLLASLNLVMYAVSPLPVKLLVAWSLGVLVKTTLAGTIAAAVYRPR